MLMQKDLGVGGQEIVNGGIVILLFFVNIGASQLLWELPVEI